MPQLTISVDCVGFHIGSIFVDLHHQCSRHECSKLRHVEKAIYYANVQNVRSEKQHGLVMKKKETFTSFKIEVQNGEICKRYKLVLGGYHEERWFT